jgi:hypothetical protein
MKSHYVFLCLLRILIMCFMVYFCEHLFYRLQKMSLISDAVLSLSKMRVCCI